MLYITVLYSVPVQYTVLDWLFVLDTSYNSNLYFLLYV